MGFPNIVTVTVTDPEPRIYVPPTASLPNVTVTSRNYSVMVMIQPEGATAEQINALADALSRAAVELRAKWGTPVLVEVP